MKNHPFDKLVDWIRVNPLKVIIIGLLFLVFVFIIIPLLLTQFSWGFEFNQETGVIGDTIGGIVSPFISLLAVLLTFLAFWIQYKANIDLKNESLKSSFERRYFELLSYYDSLVDGLKVNNGKKIIEGKSVFKHWTEKINNILYFININFSLDNHIEGDFAGEDYEFYTFKYSYHVHYYGYDNFTKLSESINEGKMKGFFLDIMYNLSGKYIDLMNQGKLFDFANDTYRMSYEDLYSKQSKGEVAYGYFDKLEHYYRFLYKVVDYVVNNNSCKLDFEEKVQYLSILKAKMSSFEQLLLFYHFASGLGANWEDDQNSFLDQYQMISDMPITENTTFSPQKYFEFFRKGRFC